MSTVYASAEYQLMLVFDEDEERTHTNAVNRYYVMDSRGCIMSYESVSYRGILEGIRLNGSQMRWLRECNRKLSAELTAQRGYVA